MSSYDTLFEKIVTSEQMSKELGTNISRYRTIADAKKAIGNNKLRAIAEIINEVGSMYEKKKANAGVLAESITMDDAELKSVYRKVVSLLIK